MYNKMSLNELKQLNYGSKHFTYNSSEHVHVN